MHRLNRYRKANQKLRGSKLLETANYDGDSREKDICKVTTYIVFFFIMISLPTYFPIKANFPGAVYSWGSHIVTTPQ